MARRDNWQEEGIRLGGDVLTPRETAALVKELRARVQDKAVLEEIEQLLSGQRPELSSHARDTLQLVMIGLLMQRRR